MTAITIDNFKRNVGEYVNHAVSANGVFTLTTDKGNAVLLSENEYTGLLETLYLLQSQGMDSRIKEAHETPIEVSDDFEW